jgi:hypothetical protein
MFFFAVGEGFAKSLEFRTELLTWSGDGMGDFTQKK